MNNIGKDKGHNLLEPGYHAVCNECDWEGNCWNNIETGTAYKNAQQEADTHNKNTIHDNRNNPAHVESCSD